MLKALNDAKAERTILSPAESLNALTIGAQHHDSVAVRQGAQQAIDPFADNTLPNVSSAPGLGYRRMIKPELFFPGGREYVRMQRSGGGLTVSVGPANLFGENHFHRRAVVRMADLSQLGAPFVGGVGIGVALINQRRQLNAQMFIEFSKRFEELLMLFPTEAWLANRRPNQELPPSSQEITDCTLYCIQFVADVYHLHEAGYISPPLETLGARDQANT